MDYLWSPWRYQYIAGQKASEAGCIFCLKPAAGDDAANLIVFRGRDNYIIVNMFPYTNGHLMVAPYAHLPLLSDLPEKTATEMTLLAREAQKHLGDIYHPEGFNLGMNLGECAGAGIAGHIHMHVLPRWTGDANFMTTVGETRVLPEMLSETYRKLKAAFSRG